MEKNSIRLEFLSHLLAVVGLRGESWSDRVCLLDHPEKLSHIAGLDSERKAVVLAVRPSPNFCEALGVSISTGFLPGDLRTCAGGRIAGRLRTLHGSDRYHGPGLDILVDEDGQVAWKLVTRETTTFILCGTELIEDLVRWRQGDPATVQTRPTEAMWGFAGERPTYLFEAQRSGLTRSEERQADSWSMLAAQLLAEQAALPLSPILPHGIPGAIVVTGDDDQAFLEKYQTQLNLLEPLPVTYFLHPKTRHTSESMCRLFEGRRVELGIHPDALDAPGEYAALLDEQCSWFAKLTGGGALTVRNHGFLNDGYWEHAAYWVKQGIRMSSNLPGLDGRPLNGSFLPARLLLGGQLVDHWSIVTAVGDGIRYVDGGRDPAAAAQCITECADGIRSSGIPGVMVVNLHPQNVDDTAAMHAAVLDVVRGGFQAWTMQDCLNWFAHGRIPPKTRLKKSRTSAGLLHSLRQWLRRATVKEHR